MTAQQIRKLMPVVESAMVRTDLYGNTWVTLWYGQIADAYSLNADNEEATRELLLMLKEKKNAKYGQDVEGEKNG